MLEYCWTSYEHFAKYILYRIKKLILKKAELKLNLYDFIKYKSKEKTKNELLTKEILTNIGDNIWQKCIRSLQNQ